MTSALETIEKAMEGVTPGPWHVAECGLGNKVRAPTVYHAGDDLNYVASFADFMTFHGPTRNLENARYIAACNPVAMREVLALARQAEALKRENAEKDAEIAKLQEVLADSLSSFRCTQNVDRYPADHWCRRARALLGGENAE